ncbi:hypothetical protein WJX73_003046 [Symbiochloris irregularis]|uniref:Protein kinase domain-containing protein n=1 Tax=Symbiochloris irregularis TaxID=706552 RepID=A0AAW1PII5_9CHLO
MPALDELAKNRAATAGAVAAATVVGIGAYAAYQRHHRHALATRPGPWPASSLPEGDYDAVIVGAGPSGSTTAFYLARGGARVALLEKETFPRDKFCGDAVCTPAIRILEDMGVMQELKDHNEVKFADNGGFVSPSGLSYIGKSVEKIGEAAACAVKRTHLDARMAHAAAREGADLKEGYEVTFDVAFDEEAGLWTVPSADGKKVRGRVLVIADGATSKLATHMGYCTEPAKGICSRAFVEGGTHNTKFDGVCFYQRESLPGYSAIFRHPNDELNYCYYLIPCGKDGMCGDVKESDLKRLHEGAIKNDKFISAALGPNAKIERMKAAALRLGSQGLRTSFDDHLLIIGDAAGHIDPLTGEGIHTAIMGGKAAAQTILVMRSTGNFSRAATQGYEQRWMKAYGHDFAMSKRGAELLYRFPILLDACANEMMRKGDAMMAKWAEVMTCMRPKSYFLRPDVAVPLGFAVLRELWHQKLMGRPDRVVLPCQNLGCGDVVHRSTLDPVLRLEQKGINPKGIALILAAGAYLFARPGVLQGAVDYYIFDKISRFSATLRLGPANFRMGKKLAEGGFGKVYRADLVDGDKEPEPVIVKQAQEFGEAEVWMNERLMRAAPKYFAKFITAFEEDKSAIQNPTKVKAGQNREDEDENPLWLIWRYEGDYTLWDIMSNKQRSRQPFPYCMEELLFGESLGGPKSARRRQASVRLVLQQVLEALRACHDTGIVHRDIKPQNVIMSTKDNRAKLIDLGAAADLRVGINYVPSEFLLDPRYAPPQQYIMSTSTPRAPPLPVAALLSPVLWKLNCPDRFDMYSVGILALQLAFPSLRTDDKLIAFRKRLESLGFDLQAWRKWYERRNAREAAEGFEMLDLDDGVMWDLCKQLMAYKPGDRISSSKALQHPTFTSLSPLAALAKLGSAFNKAGQVMAVDGAWMTDALGGSGREGALTEAQLSDELGPEYRELPPALRGARNTISWWQARQGAMKRANSSRRRDPQRQAPPHPLLEEQAPLQARPQPPTRPRGGFLPWQQQRASDKAAAAAPAEEPPTPIAEEPVRKPRKRLTPNLMPWRKSPQQQEDTQQHEAAEAEMGGDSASSQQQRANQKRRGNGKLFGGLGLGRLASSSHDEEEELEEEQYEAEPDVSRGNGRSSIPKKLLPWLKTTS